MDFSKQGKKRKVEEDPDKLSEDALEDLLEATVDAEQNAEEVDDDVERMKS